VLVSFKAARNEARFCTQTTAPPRRLAKDEAMLKICHDG